MGIFLIIAMVMCAICTLFLAASAIHNINRAEKAEKKIRELNADLSKIQEQVFVAPTTGVYTFTGTDVVAVNYFSYEGKVLYDKINDTIVDGNELVELGDL